MRIADLRVPCDANYRGRADEACFAELTRVHNDTVFAWVGEGFPYEIGARLQFATKFGSFESTVVDVSRETVLLRVA